jgi:hypothetical protein
VAADDIRIRAAGPEDEQSIRSLLDRSFPGNPKARAQIMAWQYWDNPFGPPRSWVADRDGEVVAHYAGICLPGLLGGVPAVLAMGVDAATDTASRGLGLFEQLARAVYQDSGRAGMPVTYCLPNPNSLRGFHKAGGQDLGRARVLVAPLDAGWLADRFRLPRPVAGGVRTAFHLGSGRDAAVVAEPPAGLDDLWGQVAHLHGNGVARTAAWWRWRYLSRPESPYVYVESRRRGRLVGAAVAMARHDLGGPMLCVLELVAEDRASARDVVGRLATTAAPPLGAVGLAATALPGTALYRSARHAGLRVLPRRHEPHPMHVGVVDNLGARPGLAKERWSLAWGDLDHI